MLFCIVCLGIRIFQRIKKLRDILLWGNIRHHLSEWKELTSHETVLATCSGIRVRKEHIPPQKSFRGKKISSEQKMFFDKEIKTLLQNKVIVPSEHEDGELVSPIFLRKMSE